MRYTIAKHKFLLAGLFAAVTTVNATTATATVFFSESFNTGFFPNTPAGWTVTNNSSPIGDFSWFQGNPENFTSFNGTPDAYASVNFNSGAADSTISNWLITPLITAAPGARVSFVTRGPFESFFPDRLELRASPSGSTNVGNTATSVGSFTTLLLSINPDLNQVYPESWTRFEATLPTAFNGRLAFRYFVTEAGPGGNNSSLIGVDAFQVADPSEPLPQPNPPPPPPPSIHTTVGGSLNGVLTAIGEIDWYSFSHSGGSFSVNTNGSTLSGNNDTEIGLFDSNGNFVASDDDSGNGALSLLTQPNLPAGTYYLAFGGWDMSFADGFIARASGSSRDTGTYIINGLTLAPSIVKGDFGGNESSNGSFNTPDGSFNELDVEGFLLALNDQASYLVLNPTLGSSLISMGDFGGNESTNGSFNTPDGAFNELDVEGFLLALNDPAGYAAIQPPGLGGVSAIPEPAALGLLAPMGLLLSRRRRM